MFLTTLDLWLEITLSDENNAGLLIGYIFKIFLSLPDAVIHYLMKLLEIRVRKEIRYFLQRLSLALLWLTAFSESAEGWRLWVPPSSGRRQGQRDAWGSWWDTGTPSQWRHRHQSHQPPVNMNIIGHLKNTLDSVLVWH